VRTIAVQQRRCAMVQRHHLAGEADDPEAVTRALIALHATDPASVPVRARAQRRFDADRRRDALYARCSLVRWMAMRRTLFVFEREDLPTVQAAVSTPVAAVLRRRLIGRLQRNETDTLRSTETSAAGWLSLRIAPKLRSSGAEPRPARSLPMTNRRSEPASSRELGLIGPRTSRHRCSR
jgi:Winged helix DNA-binding domain